MDSMTMTMASTTLKEVTDKHKRIFTAEWQTDAAVLLAWPHENTDWVDTLAEITACYTALVEAISRFHPVVIVAPDIEAPKLSLSHLSDRQIYFCQVETNDTWTRDYGPLTVENVDGGYKILDFAFNGWGLKFAACNDNLVTGKLHRASVLRADYENHLGFVLEGGSVDSDGNGTLLTTAECLLSPNRNGDLNRKEIENYLEASLGVNRVLWIEHGVLAGDDTDSHVDTLARMAPDDTIVYVSCMNPGDSHFKQLQLMEEDIKQFKTSDGMPYNLVALPLPDPIYGEDGERLPATYANYLVTDRALFLPVYGQPANDLLAHQIMKVVFPDREIVDIDCRALIVQHGSLHCATMQFPKTILPI